MTVEYVEVAIGHPFMKINLIKKSSYVLSPPPLNLISAPVPLYRGNIVPLADNQIIVDFFAQEKCLLFIVCQIHFKFILNTFRSSLYKQPPSDPMVLVYIVRYERAILLHVP